MSSTILTPESSTCKPLPMQGKYDGRKNNGGKRNYERKPLGSKHLTRHMADELFRTLPIKALLAELIESKDAKLRFEVIKYVWDRLEGKPFVAENPEAAKTPSVLNQDNRLQVSIQQLLPSAKPKKQRKVITAQLVESTDVIQAGAKTPTPNEK